MPSLPGLSRRDSALMQPYDSTSMMLLVPCYDGPHNEPKAPHAAGTIESSSAPADLVIQRLESLYAQEQHQHPHRETEPDEHSSGHHKQHVQGHVTARVRNDPPENTHQHGGHSSRHDHGAETKVDRSMSLSLQQHLGQRSPRKVPSPSDKGKGKRAMSIEQGASDSPTKDRRWSHSHAEHPRHRSKQRSPHHAHHSKKYEKVFEEDSEEGSSDEEWQPTRYVVMGRRLSDDSGWGMGSAAAAFSGMH